MHKNAIRREQVLLVLTYDDTAGCLLRKGKRAGRFSGAGYRQIGINGHYYYEHRLVWLLFHGSFPDGEIDHINRIKTDNHIENLRQCSHFENHQNLPIRKDNSSGIRGVSFHNASKKWRARIDIAGKELYLGIFDTIEQAAKARHEAELKYHTFANGVTHG